MSLIDKEELAKRIKLITQDAWRTDGNTTVNDMIAYIVKHSLAAYTEQLDDYSARIKDELSRAFREIASLEDQIAELMYKEQSKNGKDGGLPQPKRGRKASDKTTRDAEARAVS